MYIRVVGKDIGLFRDKDIILFGSGSCGQRALEEFEKVGAHIKAFCDNNRMLAGSELNGYTVIAPEQLYDYPEASIIITSTYEEEIACQLNDMNLHDYYHIKLGVLRETIEKEAFRNTVIGNEDANRCIYDALIAKKPTFIGRLGSVELECLCHYLYFLDRTKANGKEYPENLKMMMNVNAGFFPSEDNMLDRFSMLYMDCLGNMDLIWSMWFSRYEDQLYNEYFKNTLIADYDNTVFPYDRQMPWTAALKGKKVLVIHPFDQSIRNNYKIKDKLFRNRDFLPEFELITLQAVQSIAGNTTEFGNWFEALKAMEAQMDQIDFDIALIGAGAYGLPLGAYAKSLGKKALHIGGILQLFFGIKGKAWNKLGVYNEYWTSPSVEETPTCYKKVEAGRYW